MKKLVLVCVLLACSINAFAADPAVAAAATVGFMDWFKQNTSACLGVVVAISELLALIPGFKGNGILDTILKAAKFMSEKPAA